MSEIEHVLMYRGKILHFYEKSIREKVSFYLVYTQKDENEPYILYTETPKFANEERMTKEQAIKFIKQEFNQWLSGGLHSFLTEMWVSASIDARKNKPEIITVEDGVVMILSPEPDITIITVWLGFNDCHMNRCVVNYNECLNCGHCKRIYKTKSGRIRAIGCSYQKGES